MEKEKIKYLFVISYESKNFEDLIKKIEKLIENKDIFIVISLSVRTSSELKKRKIQFKTPDLYFNELNTNKLDIEALNYAKNWYKAYESQLFYKGVSLGEMVEYDFYFLFVDSLRNIHIAESIINSESPDIIFLPINHKITEPNFACYETLPKSIDILHNQKEITTIFEKTDQPYISSSFLYIKSLFLKYIVIFINFYQIKILSLLSNKKFILFFGVYSFREIYKKFDLSLYNAIKIYPIVIKNHETVTAAKNTEKIFSKFKDDNLNFKELKYKNINLFFLLNHRFEEVFKIKFPELIGYIEWADQIVHKMPVKMLVLMEDVSPIKRTICRFFKIQKISSLVIQHGIVSKDMAGFGIMPVEADMQAVWGKNSLKWHVKRGNKLQTITGNPSYDQILKQKTEKNEVCSKFGIDPSKKIILITTGRFAGIESKYTIEVEEREIRSTFRSLKDYKDGQIIVKIHPGYQKIYSKMISFIAQEESLEIKIVKDSLNSLLAICDVLVTFSSTTAIEAMIFDKPVIIIDLLREDMVGYISSGAAIGVYDQGELVNSIKKCLYDEKVIKRLKNARDTFLIENIYSKDSKSSERVANLILSQASFNNHFKK